MEEGKTCSSEGCDAGAACEKCSGCGEHCKCGADSAESEEPKTADAGESTEESADSGESAETEEE